MDACTSPCVLGVVIAHHVSALGLDERSKDLCHTSNIPRAPLIHPKYSPDTPLMTPHSYDVASAIKMALYGGGHRCGGGVDRGRGLHSSTIRLNVSTFCGIR